MKVEEKKTLKLGKDSKIIKFTCLLIVGLTRLCWQTSISYINNTLSHIRMEQNAIFLEVGFITLLHPPLQFYVNICLQQRHPHPGKPYQGTRALAYLPCDSNGFLVAKRLREAFIAGLTFTVKPNRTNGHEVTWSDKIPHKRNPRGGK